MPACKFSNYLKTYRKRSHLTQKEMAFLFGDKSAAKICRYENTVRSPKLETLLCYSSVFEIPITEIFAEEFREISKATKQRAKSLLAKFPEKPPDPVTARKIRFLKTLCDLSSETKNQQTLWSTNTYQSKTKGY